MKLLKISLTAIAALALLVGCDTATNNGSQQVKSFERIAKAEVQNDENILNERVTEENIDIISGTTRSGSTRLTLVAEVDPPQVAGKTVHASYVTFDPAYMNAYVSYHTYDEEYGGGVEVINLCNPRRPRVISQALFSDTDVQAAEYDPWGNGRFWMASAIDPQSNTTYQTPAIIEEVRLINGKFQNHYSSRIYDLPSSVAKGVRRAGSWLYTCSSKTGGGVFTHSLNAWDYMTIVNEERYNNAKGINVDGSGYYAKHLVLEAGVNANLHIYDVGAANSNHASLITNIGAATPYTAKMMCDIDGDIAYVAMGEGGFKAFDISATATTDNPTPLFYFNRPGQGLTNAVTVDDCYIYVANGSDGLYIFEKPAAGVSNLELTPVAVYDEFEGSVNYVKAFSNFIFVASGKSGFSILYRH